MNEFLFFEGSALSEKWLLTSNIERKQVIKIFKSCTVSKDSNSVKNYIQNEKASQKDKDDRTRQLDDFSVSWQIY